MPSLSNMNLDSDLYRAIWQHDTQPHEWRDDPRGPQFKRVRVPTGPVVTKEIVIGPYTSTSSIKSWGTRNKGYYDNLTLLRVEKVYGWTEVYI